MLWVAYGHSSECQSAPLCHETNTAQILVPVLATHRRLHCVDWDVCCYLWLLDAARRRQQTRSSVSSQIIQLLGGRPTRATRAEVEDYLRQQKTPFRQLCCVDHETSAFADLVQIGRNHDGWPFCSGATINVAFVFVGTRSSRSAIGILHDPTDVLKTIRAFYEGRKLHLSKTHKGSEPLPRNPPGPRAQSTTRE